MVGSELLQTGQFSEAIEPEAGEARRRADGRPATRICSEGLLPGGGLGPTARQLEVSFSAGGELGGGAGLCRVRTQGERERRLLSDRGFRVLSEAPSARACLESVERRRLGNWVEAVAPLPAVAEVERSPEGALQGAVVCGVNHSCGRPSAFLGPVMESHGPGVRRETGHRLAAPRSGYRPGQVLARASSEPSRGPGERPPFSTYLDSRVQADDVKPGRQTVGDENRAGLAITGAQKVITAREHGYPTPETRTPEVEACRLPA
jgi:hypothetical protein